MPDGSEYSHDTYRVTGGKLHHVNERGERETLTAGATFRPTLRQVDGRALAGKAVRVASGGPKPSAVVDVDFDEEGNIVREDEAPEGSLDDLAWGSAPAKAKARSAGVSPAEMEAVGATGATGFVTSDVNRALAARE